MPHRNKLALLAIEFLRRFGDRFLLGRRFDRAEEHANGVGQNNVDVPSNRW